MIQKNRRTTPVVSETHPHRRWGREVVLDLSIPRRWDGLIAYVISQLASPPMLIAGVLALIAGVLSSRRAWMWAGLYIALAILMPLSYLAWLVRRGRVTDLDVQLREERAQPMMVAIICAGLAGMVLFLGTAPWEMVVLAGAVWLQSVAIFGITTRWKISVHSATAAGTTMLVWYLFGTPLPFLIGVPMIAWSRVRLRRHTLAQTIAGTILGLSAFLGAAVLI